MSVNVVFLAGRLQAAPTKLEKPGGEVVGMRFVVLTTERNKDENEPAGFRVVQNANHVRVLDPDSVPELSGLQAGDFICVRGMYYVHEWEANGEKKRAWYVLAFEYGESLNYAVMKGNLGFDPEREQMGETGRYKTRLRLATARRVKNEQTDEWEDETHWVGAACFFQGKAEAIAKHFHKGDEIVVMGRYVEETYTSKEGQPKNNTYIKVMDFDWGKKRGSGGGGSNIDGQPPGWGSEQPDYPPDLDDEIPF